MRTWLLRMLRFGRRALLALGVVLVLVLIFFTQTPYGREKLLGEILTRVDRGIRGSMEIGGIFSAGILRGFTFQDVAIFGEDGRPFLRADSVRTGISLPALLRGDLVFSGVRLWRPRVTLERLPGREELNVVEIFSGSQAPDTLGVPEDTLTGSAPDLISDTLPADTMGPDSLQGREGRENGRTVVLRGVRLVDGSLDILLPLNASEAAREGILTTPAPDGGPPLRRYSFREMELRLDQAILAAPGQRGQRFELEDLALVGEVWPESFRVTGLEGELRREGPRLLASLRRVEMPDSRAQGNLDVRWDAPTGPTVSFEGRADAMNLADIGFLDPRLPEGTARGDFGFELGDAGVLLDFRGTDLVSDQGRLEARGGLLLARDMGFRELDLHMETLDLAITDPWVQDTLPLRGWLDGDLALSGTMAALELEGRVDLTNPDSSGTLTADIAGLLGVNDGFSASSLQLTLAPLEWQALSSVSPLMKLRGSGSVRMILTGALNGDGLGIDGEVTHIGASQGRIPSQPSAGDQLVTDALYPSGGASYVTVAGRVRRVSSTLFLGLTGTLSPLSLTTIRASYPSLPLEGEYRGRVEVQGPLSDLQVATDLETSAGPLSLRARFDATDPAAAYTVVAEAREDFTLSRLLPFLPDPTSLRGTASLTGRGLSPDDLQGDGMLAVSQGTLAHLALDTVLVSARVQSGIMQVEELLAETGAGAVKGYGTLGLASGAGEGQMTLELDVDSLGALRPFFIEEPRYFWDELGATAQEARIAEGVDPDTLPTREEVAMGGTATGSLTLRGELRDFLVEGALAFRDVQFRTDYVEAADLSFTAEGLPGPEVRGRGEVRTDSLRIRDLDFHAGSADVEMARSGGRVRVTAERSSTERYDAQATLSLDSLGGGVVNLDQMTLQFDSLRWNLGGPASLSWGSAGYRIRDFQLVRPGLEAMRLRVDGFLPVRRGEDGDLRLEAERVDLARLAALLQMETPLRGYVNGQARMTGPPDSPVVVGSGTGRDLLYGDFALGVGRWDLDYGNQRIRMEVVAGNEGRQVLSARGSFPADLRVRPEGPRFPDGPVDVTVAVDSFPVSVALAFLDALEDVEGTLSGDLRIGGTTRDLEPSGELTLTGGAAVLPDLGVHHREVDASFVLSPDGSIQVEGSARSGGTVHVTGTVSLSDSISNPELRLHLDAESFQAVNRRDFQGRLSGSVDVAGFYRRPLVTGDLVVEEGVLVVEEVARSVEVVDLSDPAFFNVVDTSFVTLRPILQAGQNPFLQNLRLNVNLTMDRGSWLRGRELNVEMAGTLGVFWDRTERDMAFVGVLDAVRGVYSVLGRQFQVEEGTVSFPGTPGINPDLNITAVNRVRDPEGQRLDIIATVTGPLLEPRVALSSNSPSPMAESDLVSYLIFGRSSDGLTSGQARAANDLTNVFRGATQSLALGLFSSELGSVVARDVGLDYLSITQGQNLMDPTREQSGGSSLWNTTQVEVGQYLTDDIFAALQWRSPNAPGGKRQEPLASVRLETRFWDGWTLEGYWEDPLLRTPLYWQGNSDLDQGKEKIFGFFLFKEWGY